MILTREQMLEKINARIGDDTSDEALGLLTDVKETFDDFENRAKDTTDWKKKYEENDSEWREKYKKAFFDNPVPPEREDEDETPKKMSYEDLFK